MITKFEIPHIKDKKRRIKMLFKIGWNARAYSVLEQARKRVSDATPVSDDGKKHLRDGWTIKTIGGTAKARLPFIGIVYNKHTHKADGTPKKRALIKTKSGGQQDYTLLDLLEYGTRAHVITPSSKTFLKLTIGDQTIFTKRVSHPGTRPYGMVRLTRVWLKRASKKLLKQVVKDVKRNWTNI
jgi:hypothetical protein